MKHSHSNSRVHLRRAFFLTLVILVVEVAGGLLSHSLALLSDAGHIFADVFAIGMAWYALQQTKRPYDQKRSFGYHRAEVIAAFVNGLILALVVFSIFYEAINRLFHPQTVRGGWVILAALFALCLNLYILSFLHSQNNSINLRALTTHVFSDIASSGGVLLAGIVLLFTHWVYADSLISICIALFIAWGSFKIITEALNVLMEASPSEVNLDEVSNLISKRNGVDSVHDLHIWSISPENVALSCHLVIAEQSLSESEHLMQEVERSLRTAYNISHTTIQIEFCHPCDSALDECEGVVGSSQVSVTISMS
jgi:cobalt-zinc-cadmium efflux system protein